MLPYEQAKKYSTRTVFEYQDFGSKVWKSASWTDFAENVRRISRALLSLGVGVQENIGVFSQNALQYIYTDFGVAMDAVGNGKAAMMLFGAWVVPLLRERA